MGGVRNDRVYENFEIKAEVTVTTHFHPRSNSIKKSLKISQKTT
jgi:hypothetical protein